MKALCMSQHIPEAASTPAAGPLVTNSIGIRLVYIPPGTFIMGSPENEPGRHENEVLHQVTLTRSFYMGIMPVTQGEFRAVMKKNRFYFKSSVPNQDEDLPVECVEWRETLTFCTRLTLNTACPECGTKQMVRGR
jgi:formylglycine-generating enzyme required for sulfatase activity